MDDREQGAVVGAKFLDHGQLKLENAEDGKAIQNDGCVAVNARLHRSTFE